MTSNVEHPDGGRLQLLGQADRIWRRVGVRRGDRLAMLDDLNGELVAARDDGGSTTDVVGIDEVATLREWAAARDSSGRALRLHVIVPAALAGLLVAFGTVLLLLIWATVTHDVELPTPILLTLYGTSGVIALVLADVAVWMVLWSGGDPRARRTAWCLAWTLPAGAVLAIGAGVGVARLYHFRQPEISFPLSVVAVLTVMSFAVAAGRFWATRRPTQNVKTVSSSTRVPA